jgi:hypothetical protein
MDPNTAGASLFGIGIVGLLLWVVLAVGMFFLSAWVFSLYIRLVIRFLRKTLDREYRYMRGDYSDRYVAQLRRDDPRSW